VHWSFLVISALPGAAALIWLAFLALRTGRIQRLQEASQLPRIIDTLAQFEATIVARVQKTERQFLELGDEVGEAMERVTKLRNSASASASRAARLKQESEEVAQQEEPANANPFDNPDLTREEKMALVRDDLAKRGLSI